MDLEFERKIKVKRNFFVYNLIAKAKENRRQITLKNDNKLRLSSEMEGTRISNGVWGFDSI